MASFSDGDLKKHKFEEQDGVMAAAGYILAQSLTGERHGSVCCRLLRSWPDIEGEVPGVCCNVAAAGSFPTGAQASGAGRVILYKVYRREAAAMPGALATSGYILAQDLTALGWGVSSVPCLLLPVLMAPCTHRYSRACIQHSSVSQLSELCAA